jgi:hypothetical protein
VEEPNEILFSTHSLAKTTKKEGKPKMTGTLQKKKENQK